MCNDTTNYDVESGDIFLMFLFEAAGVEMVFASIVCCWSESECST